MLGQDKLRSGFHTGHGCFFALSEGTSSSVCFWVPLVSQISAVVCLGWLKCARFVPGFFAVSLRHCGVVCWGFGVRSAGGSLLSFCIGQCENFLGTPRSLMDV